MGECEESPKIEGGEVIIKDYMALENLYKQDEKLFDRIAAVVEGWLEDSTAGMPALDAKLTMLLGKEAGRIIFNLLILPSTITIAILSHLEDKVSYNRGLIAELRELVAKFHYSIHVKLGKQRNPYRVMQMYLSVNDDPLSVRIEAILFNGSRVTLELDKDDIRELIGEIAAKQKEFVMEILTQEARKNNDKSENSIFM